jgi:hypothetical protein
MDAIPSGAQGQATGLADSLATQVERLSDRLRSLSDIRLARPLPPHASRADAAHALAQLLADGAASLEGGPVRPVPRLHDLAVGDQVAVTGRDLVEAALASAAPGADVDAVLLAASAACRELATAL